MKTGTLAEWLKRSYGSFKEGSDLPEWVLPARGFSDVVDEVGEESMLEMCRLVKLAPETKKQLEKLPPPDTVSPEHFKEAAKNWALISWIKPVTEACFDARVILASFKEDENKARTEALRCISVLAVASFSPEGKLITADLASILGATTEKPWEMIACYVSAVLQSDFTILKQVSDCIKSHRNWWKWSGLFAKKAMSLKIEPKLIEVIPPVSPDIVWVLAQMVKEDFTNESRQDHPKCSAG